MITLSGASSVSLSVGEIWVDPGATATDNSGEAITVQQTGTVDTGTAGTYTLTYTAQDSSGNSAIPVTRTVTVTPPPEDTTAPVITLNGPSSITIELGASLPATVGATATDDSGEAITVQQTGTVNTTLAGTYTLTYNATDSSGNSATPVTQTVIIEEPAATSGFTVTSNGTVQTYGHVLPGNYLLPITAYDPFGHHTTENIEVSILPNGTPSLLSLDPSSVPESLTGSTVGHLSVTDDDTVFIFALGEVTTSEAGTAPAVILSRTFQTVTPNTRYWYRCRITDGDNSVTTNSDDAWVTQFPSWEVITEPLKMVKRGQSALIRAAIKNTQTGDWLSLSDLPAGSTAGKYSIYQTSKTWKGEHRKQITGQQNITFPWYSLLKSPRPWQVSTTGYNLMFELNITTVDAFPEVGTCIVEFSLQPVSGNPVTGSQRIEVI